MSTFDYFRMVDGKLKESSKCLYNHSHTITQTYVKDTSGDIIYTYLSLAVQLRKPWISHLILRNPQEIPNTLRGGFETMELL